jgi:hypothetical protein
MGRRKQMMSEEKIVDQETQNITETLDGEEQEEQQAEDQGEVQENSEETSEEGSEEVEVPESYEFPEDLKISEEQKAEYSEILKKYKAPQSAVNDLVNHLRKQAEDVRNQHIQLWYDQVKKWGEEAQNHKEYGGVNFEKNLKSVISPTLRKFGNEELIEELDQSGFGNNPRLLAFIYRVGKEIGVEADFVEGKTGSDDQNDILKVLYPSMYKDKKK